MVILILIIIFKLFACLHQSKIYFELRHLSQDQIINGWGNFHIQKIFYLFIH